MTKINFAGGEPFIVQRGKYLGELLKFCKETLNISICSVVTNGSIIHNNSRWFKKYAKYLDVMAVSCDSFDDEVNKKIGRYNSCKIDQTQIVQNCADLCAEWGVKFKINTVVNSYNWNENMVQHIQVCYIHTLIVSELCMRTVYKYLQRLKPFRWKVFQCLLIKGENDGNDDKSLRNAHQFLISDGKFQTFLDTHQSIKELVAESNETMRVECIR